MKKRFSPGLFLLPLFVFTLLLSAPGFSQEGFGRFGRYNDDGLLTLNIEPHFFHFEGMFSEIHVRFANEDVSPDVVYIDTTRKTLNLKNADSTSPDTLYYSLVYPGFCMDYKSRDKAVIYFNTDKLTLDQAEPGSSSHWMLIRASSGKNIPVVFILKPGLQPDAVEMIKETGNSRLEIDAEDIGRIRVVTPIGIMRNSAGRDVQKLKNLAQSWSERGFPHLTGRTYAYNREEMSVTITETFESRDGSSISPVPPVLAFAMSHDYPASVEQDLIRTDCVTKYGTYAYVEGTTVTCTLPVPPLEDRGYLRIPGRDSKKDKLNQMVSHMPGEWATNGVDLAYAGIANAQMAHPYLDAVNRNKVKQAWGNYLWKGFKIPVDGEYDPDYTGPKAWKEETEPFTGETYLWTYKISGPAPRNNALDIEWGNMLPLYGLYKYAQFTGDWDFVRDRWWTIRDHIFRYMHLGDDWAWMTNVNGDMGYSTGTGDPMTAAYGGQLACLKMARALGEKDDEAYFAYKCARVAIPAVSRFWYTDWARNEIYAIYPNNVVLGFWEKRSVVSVTMDQDSNDPWSPTTNLSGDGVLPESFSLFLEYGREALKEYEGEFAQYYPDWYNADHDYPFSTTYGGNSVYITFPHLYSRSVLGEDSTETLWGYFDKAFETESSAYFIGPNVAAELLSREAPFYLTEWAPAAYNDGYVENNGNLAVLNFTLPPESMNWKMTGRVREKNTPVKVEMNGKEIDYSFDEESRDLSIEASMSGDYAVKIYFAVDHDLNVWDLY